MRLLEAKKKVSDVARFQEAKRSESGRIQARLESLQKDINVLRISI
jgi:hypothetical protein